ncbi:hypothetical protein [Sphingomonas sp. SUN039]|uniref:hypothetical protein n=1 Tax=Sphingomonas sp. SUN039 TaxID=2937787 RepID=UPI002164A453|nr:hypothetical protein [Sphingomonas sp. SUN039]UVO55748.1 hypothetical protein M0209_17115 [Sphingomonas sp. SUN039]
MSTYWLRGELARGTDATTDDGDPILTVYLDGGKEARIYCPEPDEYQVCADVVQKASDLGATIVAYGSWCDASVEGKMHAKEIGLSVVPYAGLFAFLRRNGVSFSG